jgi:hypothetical protein
MVEIRTQSGFTCQLDDKVMDNMELVETMTEDCPSEAFRNAKLANLLLGEQKEKLYNHVRENGRVPIRAVEQELREIFQAFGSAGKNS